jgi:hypothetical protein
MPERSCWTCYFYTGPGHPSGCWRPGARSRSWLREGCGYGWACVHWLDVPTDAIEAWLRTMPGREDQAVNQELTTGGE